MILAFAIGFFLGIAVAALIAADSEARRIIASNSATRSDEHSMPLNRRYGTIINDIPQTEPPDPPPPPPPVPPRVVRIEIEPLKPRPFVYDEE